MEPTNTNTPITSDDFKSLGFQLFFAGGVNKQTETALRTSGGNRLASQIMDRKAINEWIEADNAGQEVGKLFIDSGAFSAHCRGVELDVDEYIEFVNKFDKNIYIFAQADTIPGVYRQPKTPEQIADAPKHSWENYLYMRERVVSPQKLLPIYHQGEDIKWLYNILDWRDENGQPIPYMGISPANDMSLLEKEKFISYCFKIIKKSSNPNICTHAFGMATTWLLERFPLTSADSTTWIMNGANGSIMTKFGNVIISEGNIKAPSYIKKMPKAGQQAVADYVGQYGYSVENLSTDYNYRIRFNLEYMLRWWRGFTCKPSTVTRRKLF